MLVLVASNGIEIVPPPGLQRMTICWASEPTSRHGRSLAKLNDEIMVIQWGFNGVLFPK